MAKLSDLPRIIKNLLLQKTILEAGAVSIRRAIPKRTRSGRGVAENLGETHKLPALTKNTKKFRRELKKKGGLTGPGATPGKSGFNRTGDSLNNLKVEVSHRRIDVTLAPADQAKLIDALQINKEYQFMRLSRGEFTRVVEAMVGRIRKALSKVNITEL